MRVVTPNAVSNGDTTVTFTLRGSSRWYVFIAEGSRPPDSGVSRNWTSGEIAIPLRPTSRGASRDTLWVQGFGGPRQFPSL